MDTPQSQSSNNTKNIMIIISIIGLPGFVIMAIYSYIAKESELYTMGYMVAAAFMYALLESIVNPEQEKKMNKFREKLATTNDLLKYEVSYLGGHPLKVVSSPCSGILGISDSRIGFLDNLSDGSIEIELTDIIESAEETNESLTLGRFLMVGILAFALKKKRKYLRISLKNGIGEISTIVFETPKANLIAQLIMKKRYEYIISQKRETKDTI